MGSAEDIETWIAALDKVVEEGLGYFEGPAGSPQARVGDGDLKRSWLISFSGTRPACAAWSPWRMGPRLTDWSYRSTRPMLAP